MLYLWKIKYGISFSINQRTIYRLTRQANMFQATMDIAQKVATNTEKIVKNNI